MQIQILILAMCCVACAENASQISTPPRLELSTAQITRPSLVKLTARVSKDTTSVEFFQDGQSLGVDSAAPFETQLALTKAEQVTHQFTIKTFNAAGKSVSSEAVKLEVKIVGKVWFVSKTGSDGNDGLSEAKPLLTMQNAADKSQPGDTILVMNGTYTNPDQNDNVVTLNRSGTANAWIALMAYPGQKPKIQSRNWQGISVQASYILVEGFTVEGNRDQITLEYAMTEKNNNGNPLTSGNCMGVSEKYNTSILSHHVVIRGNTVSKCPGGGIYTIHADYVTIEDNTVWGNSYYSPYDTSGISMYQNWNSDTTTGYKMIVRRNVVYGNQNKIPFIASDPDPAKRVITDGNGIIIDDSRNTQNNSSLGVYTGRTLVENNVVFENGARGLHVYESDHVDIVNNTSYHNSFQPETPEGEVSTITAGDVRVFNNILVPRSDRVSITRYSSDAAEQATQVFERNLVFGGLGFDADKTKNLIGIDPKFVNPTIKDFRLQNDSPAIDAGSSSLNAKDDIEGNIRPLGAGIDLGAYEVR
jgi:parallel beta-helix repeat protein